MRKLHTFLAVISLAGGSSLKAQIVAPAQPPEPPRGDESCTTNDGKTECRVFRMRPFMDSALMKRAALGVSVQTTGTKRDTLGVFIERVTPNGPAESAGVVEGERIASINGVDLRVPAADVEDSYTAGLATHRLTRELQKLTPGARVTLRVYSGGRYRDVQVTTAKASDLMKNRGMGFLFDPGQIAPNLEMLRNILPGRIMLRGPTPTPTPNPKIRMIPGQDFNFDFDFDGAGDFQMYKPRTPAAEKKGSAKISGMSGKPAVKTLAVSM
jgi:hypothetical protein